MIVAGEGADMGLHLSKSGMTNHSRLARQPWSSRGIIFGPTVGLIGLALFVIAMAILGGR